MLPLLPLPRPVDLAHGAQGVVSKLRGQMHGPSPLFRSMPVKDLTMQVPIRKGQAFQTSQSSHKLAHPAIASAASVPSSELCRSRAPGQETDRCRPCTQPSSMAPHTQPGTPLAKMPLQSLMTAVHEVSEVLHVLGKHHRDLSRALFERLISCALSNDHCCLLLRSLSNKLKQTVWLQVELRHGSKCMLCGRVGFHGPESDCGESISGAFPEPTGLQNEHYHNSKGVTKVYYP